MTPERVMNVPKIESRKVPIISDTFQRFSMPRFSWIITECRNAVIVSHGSKRGVLHRVPRPDAAPAQLDVGPPHAEGDADRQEEPRHQRPFPHRDDPAGVEPPGQQRRDRERERDGDADVAEIQHRRVHHHAGVLQLRIEPAPVGRREGEPLERIGAAEQHHRDEERDDQAGDAGDVGQQAPVARRGQRLRQRAEDRQDHRPEQQRALLSGPERRNEVVGRQVARRVRRHVLDVEIVREDSLPQRNRGHQQRGAHRVGRRASLPRRARGGAASGPKKAMAALQHPSRSAAQSAKVPSSVMTGSGFLAGLLPDRARSASRTWRSRRWRGTFRRGPACPRRPRRCRWRR